MSYKRDWVAFILDDQIGRARLQQPELTHTSSSISEIDRNPDALAAPQLHGSLPRNKGNDDT